MNSRAARASSRAFPSRLESSFTVPIDRPTPANAKLAAGLQAVFARGYSGVRRVPGRPALRLALPDDSGQRIEVVLRAMSRSVRMLLVLSFLWPLTVSAQTADDFVLVDCRLPPKVKRIGERRTPSPGSPCARPRRLPHPRRRVHRVRPRELPDVAPHLAGRAAKGDHDAEYYVGKIYEDGLGTEPDYKAAASWYEKAAAAGHSASQSAWPPSTKGPRRPGRQREGVQSVPQGVRTSRLRRGRRARQVRGAGAGRERSRATRIRTSRSAAASWTMRRSSTTSASRTCQRQLDELRTKAACRRKRWPPYRPVCEARRTMALAEPAPTPLPLPAAPSPAPRSGLGRFFALVIGNSQYDHLPPVPSAEHDARAMQALLHDAYGFQVTLLLNAKSAQILSTLHTLSQTLDENGQPRRLLRGHGRRDLRNRRGWWLAADADPSVDAKTNWIPKSGSERPAGAHRRAAHPRAGRRLVRRRHHARRAAAGAAAHDGGAVDAVRRDDEAPPRAPRSLLRRRRAPVGRHARRLRCELPLHDDAHQRPPAPEGRLPRVPPPSRGRQRVDVRRAGHFRAIADGSRRCSRPSTTASTSCSSANELAPGDRQPIRRSGQARRRGHGLRLQGGTAIWTRYRSSRRCRRTSAPMKRCAAASSTRRGAGCVCAIRTSPAFTTSRSAPTAPATSSGLSARCRGDRTSRRADRPRHSSVCTSDRPDHRDGHRPRTASRSRR